MDDQRLDELTKKLAQPISRRQVLLSLLGAIFGSLFVRRGAAASSGCRPNPACALWCEAVFGFGTPATLQCISDAARCTGLCYSCGAKMPPASVCCTRSGSVNCSSYSEAACCPSSVEHGVSSCHGGHCDVVCQPGYTKCNGQCVSTSDDNNNCGGCGVVCPGNLTCHGGNCICMTELGYCFGTPSDMVSEAHCFYCQQNWFKSPGLGWACCCGTEPNLLYGDPNNCGACGATCGPGGICNGNQCTCGNGTTCAVGESCCNDTCSQLQTDPNNCGACGHVCGHGQVCVNGACYTDCGRTGVCFGPGCTCYSDGQGHSYCGETIPPEGQIPCDSANPCTAGKICASTGYCITPCGACPSANEIVCRHGCTNPDTDSNNCGACGHVCPSGAVCCGGTCITPSNDPNNCGGCGITCAPDGTCSNGVCTCGNATCAPGQACCNGSCVDLQSDQCNCGACGAGCPASGGGICSRGVCTYNFVRDCSQLNNCFGNGICNFLTGTCQCQGDWIGEDCGTYLGPPITCDPPCSEFEGCLCPPDNPNCQVGVCVSNCFNGGTYCSGVAICDNGVCQCPPCYQGSDCSGFSY